MRVERRRLKRWQGLTRLVFQPSDFDAAPKELVFHPASFDGVEGVRERFRSVAAEASGFLSALPPERLSQLPALELLDGSPFYRPLWRQLQHAVNHSTYHRGQVALILRRLGYVPAPTDFVGFEG